MRTGKFIMTEFPLLCFGHESMRESGKRKRNRVYQIDKNPEKLFKNERTMSTRKTIKNNKLREKVEAVVLQKITKH